MKKKDAPLPVIQQRLEPVPSGRKALTEIQLGPHKIVLEAYPNRGYYAKINGLSVDLS